MLAELELTSVRPMDEEPRAVDGARWQRFVCDDGTARALASIAEHDQLPGKIVVTVSTDLRRLPLIWRLPADLRLVQRLARVLEHRGAKALVE
jgi:hypothetical protein